MILSLGFGADSQRQIAALKDQVAKQAEAIAAREAFLLVAAHELRNPMTPILGRVQLLLRAARRDGLQPEKVKSGLEQLEWHILRYIKRATTLLDISRVTTGHLRFDPIELDICVLVREVAESLAPIAGHSGSTIECHLPDDGLFGCWDPLALEQILDNLITNAIKYGEGKPIVISARAEAGTVILEVRDGGLGVPLEDQARIFDRFERAVAPGDVRVGFGVGLWLVYQMASAMGGSIRLSSAPNEGSAFSVTLPHHSPKENP